MPDSTSASSSASSPLSVPSARSSATGTSSSNNFTDTKPSRPLSPGPHDDAQDLDCNICLFASNEPVVSRCGHLYCWACLHKWLQAGHADCPVCKTTINKKGDIIPLYGRSNRNNRSSSTAASSTIPPRPTPHTSNSSTSSSHSSSSTGSASSSASSTPHVSPPFASLFGPSFNFHSQHGTFSFSAGYGLFPAIFGLQFAAFQLQELLRGGGGSDGAVAGGERGGVRGDGGAAGVSSGSGEVGGSDGDARLSRFLMFLGVFMLLLLLMY